MVDITYLLSVSLKHCYMSVWFDFGCLVVMVIGWLQVLQDSVSDAIDALQPCHSLPGKEGVWLMGGARRETCGYLLGRTGRRL